jgi:hypothetical protein
MTTNCFWTDERVEALRRMMADGHSAAQCAKAMSGDGVPVSRSAVLGKALRLGWAWDASRTSRPALSPVRPSRLRCGASAPIITPKPSPAIVLTRGGWPKPANPESVNIFGLTSKNCRMPLWADEAPPPVEAKMYCGRPVDHEGSSWCAGCRKLLTTPVSTIGEAMAGDLAHAERAMRRPARAW